MVDNLTLSYNNKKILENISFEIKRNGIFAILGRNGAGKTSLLYVLAGIIPDFIQGNVSGKIEVFGKKPGSFKDKFFVFQDVEDSFVSNTVVEELFSYGEDGKMALKEVGLSEKKDYSIFTLSHGEKHRLAIAVAIASKSKLLLFDESFSSLDFYSLKKLLPFLKELGRKSIIFFSTHNTQLSYELADEVFIIDKGSLLKGKRHLKNASKFGLRPLCRGKMYL